jgi:hypothetical protein
VIRALAFYPAVADRRYTNREGRRTASSSAGLPGLKNGRTPAFLLHPQITQITADFL